MIQGGNWSESDTLPSFISGSRGSSVATFKDLLNEYGMEHYERDPALIDAVKDLRSVETEERRRKRQIRNRGQNIRRTKKRKTGGTARRPESPATNGLGDRAYGETDLRLTE